MQQWQKNRILDGVSLVRALLSAGVCVSIALVILFYSGYRAASSNSLADENGRVAHVWLHDGIKSRRQGLTIPVERRTVSGAPLALDTLIDPVAGAETITVEAPEFSGRNLRGHSSSGADEIIHTNGTLDGSDYSPAYYGGQSTAIGGWWQGCEGTPMSSGRYDCERRFNYGTFTLTSPAELNAVRVWIGGINNWGLPSEPYLKIEIYKGDPIDSATASALLATSNQVLVGHAYPTGAERSFTFASPVTLNAGSPYTIRLYLPSGIRGDLSASRAYALYGLKLQNPTPTNGQIAFTSLRPGDSEIYVMNADGTNQVSVSNSAGHDSEPTFSPDGKRIAFRSQRDGNFEIYIMNANGTGQTNLTKHSSTEVNPDFSPDGTKILFSSTREGHSQIYVMDADGSNPINLSNSSFYDYRAEFSPDGNKIAFTSDRNDNQDIYIMNVDGSNLIRLTTNAGGDSDPTFSPDGQKIAFLSYRRGQDGVYIMNADGTNQIYISNNPATTYEPTFSPDGSRIAFGTYRTGNPEIFLMNPDGTNLVNITNNPGADLQPTWAAASVAPITPAVFSIVPSTPASSPSDQDVFISGNNFKPNLTVEVSTPGGGVETLSGGQIQNVTETSFILRATLNAPGSWSVKVRNPDNQESAALPFTVASGGANPFITSISPNAPIANGADQNLIVTGGNFQNGLKVNATFPGGGIATLQGTGHIQHVTPNSFIMRTALNTEGAWKIRVINPDNSQSPQFTFNVQLSGSPPAGLPTSVLSPVIGALRVTTANLGISDGKWEFDQHKSGYHTATGGIALSNDTFGWDINLYAPTNANADAGKAVFAVAAGQVVSYAGTPPGGGPGAVLIAHPDAQNPIWFSGYLHLNNVGVTLNQNVDSSTLIGEIGRAGADNHHLHFVVYSGRNTRGNLQSFNAVINERSFAAPNPPAINSINPSSLNQGDEPQSVTINGANFAADSIVEVQAPDGQSFTVTPQTISASSTITANVPFVSPDQYKFTIINRATGARSTGTCPQSCVNVTPAPHRAPVILIPGIMGSRLAKQNNGEVGQELWIGSLFSNPLELKNDVEDPAVWREIPDRKIVATEIVKTAAKKNIYGKLIDYLTSNLGYQLYSERYPTINPCNTDQKNADLFAFPYDWRNSNSTSAKDLEKFIQCIARIRYGDNPIPQSFKVNIIAHSMGGLVARRYILNNPNNHHVGRMVTLGTPWFGAPEFINMLENGGSWEWSSLVLSPPQIKFLAPYMKGAHELIPSQVYTDVFANVDTRGIFPFGEDGWNDYDDDPNRNARYDFGRLKGAITKHYSNPSNQPGDTTHVFHSQALQDDWRTDDTGVAYYHFLGRSTGTIGSVIAKHTWWLGHYFETVETDGDGTVPTISASKQRGAIDYNPTGLPSDRIQYFPRTDHTQLVSEPNTYTSLKCVIRHQDPSVCLLGVTSQFGMQRAANLLVEPYYRLRIDNSESVIITDAFGNITNPLSTSLDEGLQTVKINVTGEKNLDGIFPLDQNYRVELKTPATPLSITLTRSDGQTITQAVRYVDIVLPPNVLAILEVTPQGVSALKYDSDSNGTFDTTVNPTITVTGTQAQDIEPPSLTVNERTIQGGTSQIEFAASDDGAGVKTIMYSVNGMDYHVYTGALTLNASQTPFVYAFADDNVMNRAGLLTYQLTPSVVRIDGISTLAGRTSGGQQIILTGAFAGLSTVTMGGVAASWVYTNGGDTSSITITTPPHAVGVVQIALSTVSGSGYLKPNAFAYLPVVFTDDTLIAGVTTAKAQHIIELRQAVDALRVVAGLSPAPWTDAVLEPTNSTIKDVYIQELRSLLEEAAATLGYQGQTYTDASSLRGFSIKRVHIEELRQRIRAIAG